MTNGYVLVKKNVPDSQEQQLRALIGNLPQGTLLLTNQHEVLFQFATMVEANRFLVAIEAMGARDTWVGVKPPAEFKLDAESLERAFVAMRELSRGAKIKNDSFSRCFDRFF